MHLITCVLSVCPRWSEVVPLYSWARQPQCPWPSSSRPYLHNCHEWARVSRLEVVALSSPLRLIVSMYRTPEVYKGKIDTERTHMLCDSKRGPLTNHIFRRHFIGRGNAYAHVISFTPLFSLLCSGSPCVTSYIRVRVTRSGTRHHFCKLVYLWVYQQPCIVSRKEI